FEAERQALAMMDHTNIAKVYDAGTTESGRPYFVMELVHGVPITDYCDANKLTPRQRLELFVSVCHAIQHAHQKGIIHRDIKPSNILVTMYDDKPVPKVIDFGVAKAIEQRLTEKTVYTQFGTLVGTFEYMSPEQAEMNAFGVDTRSDVYALGVLLYELLTGTTPLERPRLREAALDEIRRIIKEEEPPRPSVRLSTSGCLAKIAAARQTDPAKLSRLVRGELDWVVMKCLEKDRTRRYETANGLARDVERYLRDEPVEARSPSAWYRLQKTVRRNKVALTTAAVVTIALLLGTAVSVWQAVRATRAEREAQAQRDEAQEQRQLALDKAAAARDESAKVRLTLGMLQKMLGSASRDAGKDHVKTVVQMLDAFEARLAADLRDQPDVEAELRTTLGQAYLGRNYGKAEKQFQRALQLRKERNGPEHKLVAELLTHLAWVHLDGRHSPSKAEKLTRQALAILRKGGDRDEVLAETLRTHFFAIWGQDSDEAETVLREGLSVAEQCSSGKPTAARADLSRDLTLFLMYEGRPDEAQAFGEKSVALHRQVYGDKHRLSVLAPLYLGAAYSLQHKFADAERSCRESLEVHRRVHGGVGPGWWSGVALRQIVFVLGAQHKDEEVETFLRENLAAWKKSDLSFRDADLLLAARGAGLPVSGRSCRGRGIFPPGRGSRPKDARLRRPSGDAPPASPG
ncbi:MAG: serine/threonine-protein kinase, partial [Gemmataceae bacterium]|nr:serine/threonine-protein kinase [Gemmataceae bacterium]